MTLSNTSPQIPADRTHSPHGVDATKVRAAWTERLAALGEVFAE